MSGGKSAQELMLNALKEIKTLKRQLATYEKTIREPIAVIGMGCRYPGKSDSPEAFWNNLVNGVDCITQQENHERWNMDDLYDPNPDAPGKIYSKGLGIIERPDLFDAEFFGISPREVEDIDPQHRILLEVCHEAMEDAGYAPSRLNGSRTGVFAGIASSDYAHLGSMFGSAEKLTPWQGIGNAGSAAPGRISYLYNFKGPALGLDTACSSSLVALHVACQSLRNHECDAALAGGVHLVLNPVISIVFAKARMLSADGYCKTFDAAADGYVRSEGCGVVMLKRLSDAVEAGDNILALIKGSAINQDGKSQGFTAPNETAQEDVMRAALKQAQLEPNQVSYVEAHGTGTPLGDPIELGALNTVYCKEQNRRHPLLVGSVKTNMGHSEAASGMAGVIKLILSLRQQKIPPHLHFKKPNPYIPWSQMAIQVTDKLTDWKNFAADGDALRAGVSAFAFTGTNAHVIIEEYSSTASGETTSWVPPLVLISAKQSQAKAHIQQALKSHLENNPELTLTQIARTTAAGRDHYKYRTVLLPNSVEHLKQLLDAEADSGVMSGTRQKQKYKTGFLFSDNKAHQAGIARDLYERASVFRHHFDQVAGLINPLLDKELIHLMWGDQSAALANQQYAQPALFALEYAQAKTWMQWGVTPDCVTGHGVGEIVSACIAGVFSLADACALVCSRAGLKNESDVASFRSVLDKISFCMPRMRIYTARNGELSSKSMSTPDYWINQACHPETFTAGLEEMVGACCDVMVEMGVGDDLIAAAQKFEKLQPGERLDTESTLRIVSLQPNIPALDCLTHALAQLYVTGIELDWAAIMPLKQVAPVQLPTYPFQRKSFWNETIRAHMEQQGLPAKARDWLYRVQWQPTVVTEEPSGMANNVRWLLLFPSLAQADNFANYLPTSLQSGVQIGAFEINDDEVSWLINHEQNVIPADGSASSLLSRLLASSGLHETRVVLCFAGMVQQDPALAQRTMTTLMLSLTKNILQHSARLTVITELAHVVERQAEMVRPDQAMILGFSKNLLLEMADRMQAHIDVDGWDDASIKQCANIIAGRTESPWISVRKQQLWMPRLHQIKTDTIMHTAKKIRDDGWYVVAGGTGSIGLAVCEWLIEKGARSLALLSRSGDANPDVASQISRWRQSGVQVTHHAVDLANREAVQQCLESLRIQKPLRGVIHAAGQFELVPVADLTTARCEKLMANKVLGLQWLDELTEVDELDVFAAFSSIASVWGSAGNFHYCAANQVVDAIIQRRHQRGKPALSINWGPWEDSGMVSTDSSIQAARRGLQLMNKEAGIQTFGWLLGSEEPRFVVADIAWSVFKPIMKMLPMGSIFDAITISGTDAVAITNIELNDEDKAFKERFENCPSQDRADCLLGYLRLQLSRALQLDPADIDDKQSLIEMGIDSLLAVEFKNRITRVTETELPVVRLLGGASLRDVAKWLAEGYTESRQENLSVQDEEEQIVEGVL